MRVSASASGVSDTPAWRAVMAGYGRGECVAAGCCAAGERWLSGCLDECGVLVD